MGVKLWQHENIEALNEPVYLPPPEKRLLSAVLARALRDAIGTCGGVPQQDRINARSWFLSPSRKPFGFVWIAHWLDLDAEAIRVVIRAGKLIDFDWRFNG